MRLAIAAALVLGALTAPVNAAAQNADAANGSDCSYTDTNLGVVGVETGGDGMTGDDSATAVGDSTNAGGCFGVSTVVTGTWVDLIPLRNLGIPTPICGGGNSWWDTGRDGCSLP